MSVMHGMHIKTVVCPIAFYRNLQVDSHFDSEPRDR